MRQTWTMISQSFRVIFSYIVRVKLATEIVMILRVSSGNFMHSCAVVHRSRTLYQFLFGTDR